MTCVFDSVSQAGIVHPVQRLSAAKKIANKSKKLTQSIKNNSNRFMGSSLLKISKQAKACNGIRRFGVKNSNKSTQLRGISGRAPNQRKESRVQKVARLSTIDRALKVLLSSS